MPPPSPPAQGAPPPIDSPGRPASRGDGGEARQPADAAMRLLLIAGFIAWLPAAVFWGLFAIAPADDALMYWNLGTWWARNGTFGNEGAPEAYWPPGYPAFVALVCTMAGESVRSVTAANLLLHAVTVALVGRIAFVAYGARVAAAAMVLFGWVYEVLTLPALLLSENVFFPLFLGGVALMMGPPWGGAPAAGDPARKGGLLPPGGAAAALAFAAAGLLWGLATLVRGNAIALPGFLLVAVLLWPRWPLARRLRTAGLLVCLMAAFAVPVGLWTLRNYRAFGVAAPVSLNTGDILAQSHNPFNTYWSLAPDDPRRIELGLVGTPVEVHRRGLAVAFEEITTNPLGSLVKCLPKLYWTFTGQIPWFANRELLKLPPDGLGKHYVYLETIVTWQWTIFLVLTLLGVWLAHHTDRPARLLCLGLCAYWIAFHATLMVVPRYRVPIIAVFALYAAVYLVEIHPALVRRRLPGGGPRAGGGGGGGEDGDSGRPA